MDRLRVDKKKSPKQAKAKKVKPIKVVYISNPMKVKASVADFRSVVQELTGQDSDAADLSRYGAVASDPPPPSDDNSSTAGFAVQEPPQANAGGVGDSADLGNDACRRITSPVGDLDECFDVPEMLEDFPGFLPSPLYYEPQSHGFRD